MLLRSVYDEIAKLCEKLVCAFLGSVGELYRLAKVKAEDAEDRLAVNLISSRFKVYVTLKAYENIYELINVVDLFKMNVYGHFENSFL